MHSITRLAILSAAFLPAVVVSQQLCGTTPYNPAQYSCTDGKLCPAGLTACGSSAAFSCFDKANYCCVNGQIQQASSEACANAPSPSPSPAPSSSSTPPGSTGVVSPTSTVRPPVTSTTATQPPGASSTGGASRVGTKSTSNCLPASPGSERNFCLKFDDDFNFLNFDNWKHDITLRGGGNWEFQAYTNNRTNTFVRDGKLFIKPTLTTGVVGEQFVSNGGTISYWGNNEDLNSCTDNADYGCMRTSDGTNILNPVQSGLLRSVRSFSFRYGKVEVSAKLPKGDWIWPAIWMLPKHGVYGQWPASGEIDIMESRGNAPGYPAGGYDTIGSTLHWGPNYFLNRYPLTNVAKKIPDDGFHTYGLIWTPESIITYIDDPSNIVLNVPLSDFYAKGKFPAGTADPWANGCSAAPFDQEFYLILNVAVGGTSTYFPTGTFGTLVASGSQPGKTTAEKSIVPKATPNSGLRKHCFRSSGKITKITIRYYFMS
ncbi:concanavalin A-like lectin/glucanase domain-containing protein [Chytridium lagenaria]|nr:concanavalin A-like lectin/glucanase domain-containing protein [Chytridium lagenaria]